jgi:hypothetical protein
VVGTNTTSWSFCGVVHVSIRFTDVADVGLSRSTP